MKSKTGPMRECGGDMAVTFSVVVPVLGEEEHVNNFVDHIRVVGYGKPVEIVIVDGAADRGTLAALHRQNVTTVPSGRGRGRQMNAGAARARGDILVFLHADTHLPSGAFEAMEDAIRRGAGCGAFDLGIRSSRWALRLVERVGTWRSRLTRLPYGDQAQFFRHDVFDALGGFADIPIMEDVDIMRRVKRSGIKMEILGKKVMTSARRWEREGIWACTFRNWLLVGLYFLGVSPQKLSRLYRYDA
ncbi:TIGR04283 family arsenosugar biosynthesis glycosyltransferase [Desulfovibrio inopinatus]|uniref:TIGR04283 family arsenosugar biosynthesis glycosyltransferase n=1 Tax=Desulfovibrio inopinatus TaxID=102109 RepID=UPI001FE1DB38|nr:TIGR04283 family arsenosugar biosynthesis glycosyltransferase [Desulfovibrio inopinatus]